MNPNAMFGLSRREVIQLLHHCYPTRRYKPDAYLLRCTLALLNGVHDVAIAAIEGEIVPGPIGHRSDLVTSTYEIEQVEP